MTSRTGITFTDAERPSLRSWIAEQGEGDSFRGDRVYDGNIIHPSPWKYARIVREAEIASADLAEFDRSNPQAVADCEMIDVVTAEVLAAVEKRLARVRPRRARSRSKPKGKPATMNARQRNSKR
jgi:hypothetical protein